MHFDCAIGVYKNYEVAASAVLKLQQGGIPDRQVSLVMHDVSGEIPDPHTVESGEQENLVAPSSEGATKLTPLATREEADGIGPLAKVGSIINVVAGEFFTQLFNRFSESQEIARSISDYQTLVSDHHLLVVVTGATSDVDDAARILAETDVVQVNVHYVSESSVH